MNNKIQDIGAWDISNKKFDKEHVFDYKLGRALVNLMKLRSIDKVYDFGCGHGKYVKLFNEFKIIAIGFDGNPITKTLPNCKVQDLTSDFQEKPVDFLLTLEVCEHVPKKFQTELLNTIDRHLNDNGLLVLSWTDKG